MYAAWLADRPVRNAIGGCHLATEPAPASWSGFFTPALSATQAPSAAIRFPRLGADGARASEIITPFYTNARCFLIAILVVGARPITILGVGITAWRNRIIQEELGFRIAYRHRARGAINDLVILG